MSGQAKTWAANTALLGATILACLAGSELVLRWRYPDKPPKVTAEVRQVQKYLELHPKLGFTWRENIPFADHIVLKVSDTEQDPLSTDEYGLINPPGAIEARRSGKRIDVVGLGDSFIEHGSFLFHELFEQAGLTYYNMAIHRHCPPQYNVMLRDYALPLTPRWVIYGLFENDFEETPDYEDWTRSGLDWFAFHSGTWCGLPQSAGAAERFFRRYLPGCTVAYKRLRKKLEPAPPAANAPSAIDTTDVLECINAANAAARAQGSRLLLVLIPSKPTAHKRATRESIAYDDVLKKLDPKDIETLDLRARFQNSADPRSLYYRRDGHWNRNGIREAASAILEYIQSYDGTR